MVSLHTPRIPKEILVVGAGLSGAVCARLLADEFGAHVRVIDSRKHIAGNCHTARDPKTDVMVHVYGPHIFNTNHEDVWSFVQRFGQWEPFVNRVKASLKTGVYSMPVNLHTINQFFDKNLDPSEAQAFIELLGDKRITTPANFEEQALRMIGNDLYRAFFHGYTKKQWGVDPTELPADILKRLPVRFNYNDNYYNSRYQAMPRNGYTEVVRSILDHPNIEVELGVTFDPEQAPACDHCIYTGPIDRYFNYAHGRLAYRTVTFEAEYGRGDLQGNAVINYPDPEVPFTRIHEHRHFAPWEKHEQSVRFREYSVETTPELDPYYPKRLAGEVERYESYRQLALSTRRVSFVGRLATFRYLDMDQVIGEALDFIGACDQAETSGTPWPAFGAARSK
jgi:UDP-galactopyranose mutase